MHSTRGSVENETFESAFTKSKTQSCNFGLSCFVHSRFYQYLSFSTCSLRQKWLIQFVGNINSTMAFLLNVVSDHKRKRKFVLDDQSCKKLLKPLYPRSNYNYQAQNLILITGFTSIIYAIHNTLFHLRLCESVDAARFAMEREHSYHT